MDAIQQGIIALMKSAITGEHIALPEEFDIEAAYPVICRHHVAPMAYAGAVSCGVDPTAPAMQKLFYGYCKAVQVSERQMNDLARVLAAFDAEGIDYLPLKGCRMKAMYPRAELRGMGDADVLIRTVQYDRIRSIMNNLDFEEGSEEPEHVQWRSGALCVELHRYLIAPKFKAYHAYFGDGWAFARAEHGTRYAMSVEDTFVFQFTHFAKHYGYAGIGCRHVVDLWVYLRHYPQMDEAQIREKLGEINLCTFYENIVRLLGVWFEGEEGDERTEFIAQVIFSNGSFGHESNRLLTKGAWAAGETKSMGKSRMNYIWRCVFPTRLELQNQYPILRKAPYLQPAVWLVRLTGKLLRLPVIWRTHSRNLRMLSGDRIDERRKALEYVGLSGTE